MSASMNCLQVWGSLLLLLTIAVSHCLGVFTFCLALKHKCNLSRQASKVAVVCRFWCFFDGEHFPIHKRSPVWCRICSQSQTCTWWIIVADRILSLCCVRLLCAFFWSLGRLKHFGPQRCTCNNNILHALQWLSAIALQLIPGTNPWGHLMNFTPAMH